jgi:hypothetical protein
MLVFCYTYYCLTIWIKNPYGQHDAKCMEHDAFGYHTTHLDIIV